MPGKGVILEVSIESFENVNIKGKYCISNAPTLHIITIKTFNLTSTLQQQLYLLKFYALQELRKLHHLNICKSGPINVS